MENMLSNYFKDFNLLSQEEILLILSHFQQAKFETLAIFKAPGSISKRIGFVQEGVFRVYYNKEQGGEETRYFVSEGQFLTDIDSFIKKEKTESCIQAIIPSLVNVISFDSLEYLRAQMPALNEVFNRATTEALLKKLENRSPLISEDAKTRYLNFVRDHKEIIKKVPLNYIASYLGITPQSLSRIRATI